MTSEDSIKICIGCKFRTRPCGDKPCLCEATPELISIRVRADSGQCPKDYFAHPPTKVIKPKRYGPGSVVKVVLGQLGYHNAGNCHCAEFEAKMNRWGWWSCALIHRAEIVAWFISKAREQNIEVSGEHVWELIRGAIADLRMRRRASKKKTHQKD